MYSIREAVGFFLRLLKRMGSPPDPLTVFAADNPQAVREFVASIVGIQYPEVKVGDGYEEVDDVESFFKNAWFRIHWPPQELETGWIIGRHEEDPLAALEAEKGSGAIVYNYDGYRYPLAVNLEEFLGKLRDAGWRGFQA